MLLLLVALLVTFTSTSTAQNSPPNPPSEAPFDFRQGHILSSVTFRQALSSKDLWIFMFHVSWCGHCKRLKPIMAELSEHEVTKDSVSIGFIDCEQESALCKGYNVTGYPTVKYYFGAAQSPQQQLYPYSGSQTLERLVDFIIQFKRYAKAGDSLLETVKTVPTTVPKGVLFVFENIGSGEHNTKEVAMNVVRKAFSYDDVKFVQVKSTSPKAKLSLVNDVFGGDDTLAYTGEVWGIDELIDFISSNRFRAFQSITGYNFGPLARRGQGRLVIAITSPGERPSESAAAQLTVQQIAKERRGDNAFSFASLDGEQWTAWVQHFGIQKSDLPTVLVFLFREDVYYFNAKVAKTLATAWSHTGAEDKAHQTLSAWLSLIEIGKEDDIPVSGAATVAKYLRPYIPGIDEWRRSFPSDTAFIVTIGGAVVVFVFVVSIIVRLMWCPPKSMKKTTTAAAKKKN